MARTSTSLDLSEFLNNDDSDGLRLAEFLQKRRGDVKKQNFLFMNCEPQRLSLNVQLEKITPSQENQNSTTNNDKETSSSKETNKEKQNEVEMQNRDCDNKRSGKHELAGVQNQNILANNCNKSREVSPIKVQNVVPTANTSGRISPFKAISPARPESPRISTIGRSGGVSPGDRLRRYSLRRLSKMCSGRRTLLQEFESTISDTAFNPPLCSTPFSEPPPDKPTSPITSPCPEAQNVAPSTAHNTNTNDSCCVHTNALIRSLQRKEDELKGYMNNFEETVKKLQSQSPLAKENCTEHEKGSPKSLHSTKSPMKRTYTVERGSTPGQIILTPGENSEPEDLEPAKQLKLPTVSSPSKTLNTSKEIDNPMIIARVKSFKKILSSEHINKTAQQTNDANSNSSERSGTIHRRDSLSNKNSNHGVPKTPPPYNVSLVFPTQEPIGVEENRNITKENNTVEISSSKATPVVIIPLTQNFNKTSCIDKNCTNNSRTTNKQNNNDLNQLNEDNLKLTDIITDDEEETPKAIMTPRTIEDSSAPLNLAPSSTNKRERRLRKRSISRRRLEMDNTQFLGAENRNHHPPQAHFMNNLITRNRILRKRPIPLNKAPGIPLNGEEFAEELARMSNYEILDLRKRNSMGKLFATSTRKSTRALESAAKKQKDLEDKIEMELLRRNIQADSQNNVVDETSLVDENLADRVSFKNRNENPKKSKGSNLDKMSDMLKNYLEVSEMLIQKKKRSYLNLTKRSLYSEEISESSEENSFVKPNRYSMRNKKSRLPCVPSPPKSNSQEIDIPKVVSPPPPITDSYSSERELNKASSVKERENELFLPPPPEFDSDSGNITNNIDTQTPTNSTTLPDSGNITNNLNTHTPNNTTTLPVADSTKDDDIFKKPMMPPPKSLRKHKTKTVKSASMETPKITEDVQQSDKSTDELDGTLRRSKRSRVPVQNPCPLIQMIINKNLEKESKQKLKREKLLQTKAQSDNTTQLKSSLKPKRTRNVKRILPTIPENYPLEVPSQKKEKTIKKKTTKKNKTDTKQATNKQGNSKTSNTLSNETLERCHLELTNPPPIDHLNNVFDQLRNTTSYLLNSPARSTNRPTTNQSKQEVPLKTKPLRVRISRLKSSQQIRNPETEAVSSANKALTAREVRRKSPSPTNSTQSQGSSITTNNASNHELIMWLKNISESNSITDRSEAIFKEMRISAAANLSFTELQGIEYAFYDTDEKASLGYLRFKPWQKKPKKKAKLFHLHFITLVGKFRIIANNEETIMNVGDMVAIEKFVYYFIENLTDDIGILMVIKK